jgi:hypothetical protein
MNDQAPRRLPKWTWVLAAILFPPGVFVAYGSAGLLPWWPSILLAALSYACVFGFVEAMRFPMSRVAHSAALLTGVLVFWGWGYALYRIGKAKAYWSTVGQRVWRRGGWFALAIVLLSVVGLILEGIASLLKR